MSPMTLVALLLVGGVLAGVPRILRDRAPGRVPHAAALVACAAALWLVLFPPAVREAFRGDTLVVLTPGATPSQAGSLERGPPVVALPGVDPPARAEAVADLGSALRAHPGTRRLLVVGGGLPARDRDAARGLAVAFEAAPLPRGLVEWSAPERLAAGSAWHLRGRVAGLDAPRVELRDPADAPVADAVIDEHGQFALHAHAGVPGRAVYRLHVYDGDAPVESLPVPLATHAGDSPRVLLLSGAPDPELKYLRRWASDAGVDLASRITLSEGVALRGGRASLDPADLANTDLVIVDERSWAALDATARSALTGAARDGLGLLLRVTGPLPAGVAADWAALGIGLAPADVANAVELETQASGSGAPVLSRVPVRANGAEWVPLVRAADGSPLAVWHAFGRGRVAAWWLRDTWRLRLAGDAAGHGALWSSAIARVARARGTPRAEIPAGARVGERIALCGLAEDAQVLAPSGARVDLVVDPASGARRCAGFWPGTAGWHTLVSAGVHSAFRVRAADEATTLARAATADATRLLVGGRAESAPLATRERRLPRWPFFGLWLAASAGLWWYEKSRRPGSGRS